MGAANNIQGKMDASEFKEFIFGMLFLKRFTQLNSLYITLLRFYFVVQKKKLGIDLVDLNPLKNYYNLNLYEWLIFVIPLLCVVLFMLRAHRADKSRNKGNCPNCGTELIKFADSQNDGGGIFLWLCGSIKPTIVGVSSSTPHQDWFISCKGINTKINGMRFENLSKEELVSLTKRDLPFNRKKPECPDCNQKIYKFGMFPTEDGCMATLWLCGNAKIKVIQTRASGAVQDWLLSCVEMNDMSK